MATALWRVALLEDNKDTRLFFERCIASCPQLALVGSFSTLAAAQTWFATHTTDVLLTDLGLPDGHGLTLIRALSAQQPQCDILVVSVFGDEDTVLSCVEAGAVGYIHKDSQPQDVAQVILDVKQGASPISPMIARKLLERLRNKADGATATPEVAALIPKNVQLSPGESQVLELIARGYGYAEIARLQEITIHTVQSHIKKLYRKLAVHSRSEAVFEASRLGLLQSMQPGS